MTYLAVRRVRGPAWDHALPMRSQALWAGHAVFMNALAADPWTTAGLLEIGRVEPWTVLLDARTPR
jgi:hypothetical protein